MERCKIKTEGARKHCNDMTLNSLVAGPAQFTEIHRLLTVKCQPLLGIPTSRSGEGPPWLCKQPLCPHSVSLVLREVQASTCQGEAPLLIKSTVLPSNSETQTKLKAKCSLEFEAKSPTWVSYIFCISLVWISTCLIVQNSSLIGSAAQGLPERFYQLECLPATCLKPEYNQSGQCPCHP